ncbi:MAG: hypothetical protein JW959_05260 [Pirellulales bacterium]|nr:hypothetical protein [Pirellulales bacterium]
MRRTTIIVLILSLPGISFAAEAVQSAQAAGFRLAAAAWCFGDAEDALSAWTKEKAVELTEKLCGKRLKIAAEPTAPFSIIVGTPDNNNFVKRAETARLIDATKLSDDDYLLKQTRLDDKDVLIVAGRTPRAAMYGVFDFFERLGCRFLISGDVVPETNPDLTIPKLDVLRHTDNTWRGLMISYCFATNSSMSLCDYQRMFDQMAKMRMNRILYHYFENEPFIDYSYRGERKLVGDISHPDSGYISYGRSFSGSYLVEDLPVGRDKFKRRRVAPLEFQDVKSSDEALDVGREFVRRLIEMAGERGIRTWLTILPTFVSPNLQKYTRPMPRPHEHWSGLVSCADPVVAEINRNRIRSVVDSYPGIEGILLSIPEGYDDDPYPDAKALVEREWDNYVGLLKYEIGTSKSMSNKKRKLEADIRFVKIVEDTIRVAKEVKPDVRLGVFTVCKAYILTHLDKTLPKDMPFVDIESGSLWGGNPLHLFKQMRGRECVIVPRAEDDGSLAGMQFNLNLYRRDRFLQSNKENGTRGFMIQTTHVRGNEHNVKYLADGLWNDRLTPEEFYEDYAQTLFGPDAAAPMIEAFRILERNESFLGGRGGLNMPWNQVPPEIYALRAVPGFGQPLHRSPIGRVEWFQERGRKFRKSVEYLVAAEGCCKRAEEKASEPGRRELHYLINRNRGYIHHLETLAKIGEVFAAWRDALNARREGVERVREKLHAAADLARRAEEEAHRSAEHFAACAEHPTDLGVLWMIGSKMVVGTRLLREHLENVAAYYDGREYWKKIDWGLLFGSTPYPTHDLKRVDGDGDEAVYEPG